MRRLFTSGLFVGIVALLSFAAPAAASHGNGDDASPNM
jgi:hypothetical protein